MSDFEYKIEYKKRKTISIVIENKNSVLIKVPIGTSNETINKVIEKKRKWIISKLEMMSERKELKENEILYLGNVTKIKVIVQPFIKRDFVVVINHEIVVNVSSRDKYKRILEKWLREEAKKVIEDKINKYCTIINKVPKEVKIKEQKTKWGSCTYDNRIFFNWKLIMAREEAIEYVVVHEMCHMIHKNHSKEYWSTVEAFMPSYKKEHNWLKENGYLLRL
ncbi:MAG: M48 family metallopeptidase [Clostridium sp.]|nr:M48 family metallopeptidase [Clostridium sp.]